LPYRYPDGCELTPAGYFSYSHSIVSHRIIISIFIKQIPQPAKSTDD